MRTTTCQRCRTVLRYPDGADRVDCNECRTTWRLVRRVRRRGGGVDPLARGILEALRDALGKMPGACKRCQGTGLANPAAAERAAARGTPLRAPAKCPACKGKQRR